MFRKTEDQSAWWKMFTKAKNEMRSEDLRKVVQRSLGFNATLISLVFVLHCKVLCCEMLYFKVLYFKVLGREIKSIMHEDIERKQQHQLQLQQTRKKQLEMKHMLEQKRQEAIKHFNYHTPLSLIKKLALQQGSLEPHFISSIAAQTQDF